MLNLESQILSEDVMFLLSNPFKNKNHAEILDFLSIVSYCSKSRPNDRAKFVWISQSHEMMRSVLPAICWKRDHLGMDLNVKTLSDSIDFFNILSFIKDSAFTNMPSIIKDSVISYLIRLPEFNEVFLEKQPPVTIAYHKALKIIAMRPLLDIKNACANILGITNKDVDDLVFLS